MARFFDEIWIPLTMLILVAVVSLIPVAWSVDMEVRDNTYDLTPVSAIEGDFSQDQSLTPAILDGDIGVDQIKSLEYKPPTQSQLNEKSSVEPEQPVTLSPALPHYREIKPVPTFAIFPVLHDSFRSRAFGDIPSMVATTFANELANTLHATNQEARVMNPLYALDELEQKGLYNEYLRLIQDYKLADHPQSDRIYTISDRLSTEQQAIAWVVFVEAEFDPSNGDQPITKWEKALDIAWARQPKDPKYRVTGRIKIYSTQEGTPLVWEQTYTDYIKLSQFGNFTSSVFDDMDSYQSFKALTTAMAKRVLHNIPIATYSTQTAVQANIVQDEPGVTLTPEDAQLSEPQPVPGTDSKIEIR